MAGYPSRRHEKVRGVDDLHCIIKSAGKRSDLSVEDTDVTDKGIASGVHCSIADDCSKRIEAFLFSTRFCKTCFARKNLVKSLREAIDFF
ncbi:hypothetical protein QE369_001068 [Agrobacterium larrymoorei]|uniref:Uncharacterized protein n=1 Tax=Agrobacterium larrymoorei TaxID=160699 RepID=A0AAJ2B7M0_9HYPH|nr:hypothetical protein [Agrobacterium larrymoorei]